MNIYDRVSINILYYFYISTKIAVYCREKEAWQEADGSQLPRALQWSGHRQVTPSPFPLFQTKYDTDLHSTGRVPYTYR